MANNINLTEGSGKTARTVDIGGFQHQVILPYGSVSAGSTLTRPNDTTAYAAGDMWANSTTAGSVVVPTVTLARGTDESSFITGIKLKKSGTVLTNALFRIHLFNVVPTVATAGDNATIANVTFANWIGAFNVTVDIVGSDVSWGLGVPHQGSAIAYAPVSGAATLYWLPEVRAAYTPIAQEVLTLYAVTQ